MLFGRDEFCAIKTKPRREAMKENRIINSIEGSKKIKQTYSLAVTFYSFSA